MTKELAIELGAKYHALKNAEDFVGVAETVRNFNKMLDASGLNSYQKSLMAWWFATSGK